ncbi:ATP12 family protein [Bradyrhizobium sp. G127]|uniref:ATP12 family chaperone protein n=1 Tax=Bradyrhizobium sp. G127 TaxID=2904800 RepID=UPI001F32ABD7|nr:ATP12 family protein [Bradyrhizobium sp. G127]MCF2524083.1 ATPase [Bradyrhizobium sp. G127]
MRELFDEVAGKSPLDPREASRKSSRTPLRKRFYTSAGVVEAPDGFAVTLDGKPVRTPGRNPLAAPTRELAEAMAAEWQAQPEMIDPMAMPLTRLANSVIDGVAGNVQAVADDAAKYFETDLLFYRAGFPEELIAKQAEHWDPVLRWAADDLGAHFILTEGVIHVQQPETAVAAVRAALPADAWPVGAFHVVTTITGSALLALALKHRTLDEAQVWAAAHVDEDWNREKWGIDDEVEARRVQRQKDFEAAALVLKALG